MESNQYMKAGDEYLEHFGKKGMRWGHRTATAAKAGVSSVSKKVSSLSPNQKRAAIIAVGTGATVAAGLLAGPIGSMVVSGLSRAVSVGTTKNDSSFPVPHGTGDTFKGTPSWAGPKDYGIPSEGNWPKGYVH